MKKEEIYLDLSKLSSDQIKNVGKVLEDNNENVYKNTKERLRNGVCDYYFNLIHFNVSNWQGYNDKVEDKTEITYIEFLSLFEKDNQEEWQPKQGDKVLVSDGGTEWCERIFVLKYKDKYLCERNSFTTGLGLYRWNFIKPFKEEKNWYRIKDDKDYSFHKLSEEEIINIKAHDCEVLEVTNPQLIELLEKELNNE